MTHDLLPALGNHLWQSTVFGLCAASVALSLPSAPAKVRSSIWLTAALKFLFPFSMLIAIGGSAAPPHRGDGQLEPAAYFSLDAASQPFTYAVHPLILPGEKRLQDDEALARRILPGLLVVLWLAGALGVAGRWMVRSRRLAASLAHLEGATRGIELETLRSVEARMGRQRAIPILLSDAVAEPGIFGLWRPRLVWPCGMTDSLGAGQLEAIMAHEIAHAERRDNLIAALHLAVEALFWFHPMVWWLHRRMLDERERACDETVILLGNEPEAYAEGILRACRFSVEAPLACMAGISGSELKQRIRRIVAEKPAAHLAPKPKLLLCSAIAMSVLAPVVFGFIDTPRVAAGLLEPGASTRFAFEVATVKPGEEGSRRRMFLIGPGKVTVQNMSLKEVIMFAYDAKSTSQISGYPEWVNTALYNIDAKEDEATAAALDKLPREEHNQQIRLMMQGLLAERFHLVVSHATKELPVYALVVAKGGPKLKTSPAPSPTVPEAGPGSPPKMTMGVQLKGPGELQGINITLDAFASGILSRMPEVGDRVVVDKTGLRDHYDFNLRWTPDTTAPGQTMTADGGSSGAEDTPPPGLFIALEEQLGLRLESQKGTVETLVVDSIERPTPN